jgi:hypothetical protein
MSDGSFHDMGVMCGKEVLFPGSYLRRYCEWLRRGRMVRVVGTRSPVSGARAGPFKKDFRYPVPITCLTMDYRRRK